MKNILILLILICTCFFSACSIPPPGPPGRCVGKHTESGLFCETYWIRIEPSEANGGPAATWDYQLPDRLTYDRWHEGDELFWPNYKGSRYK